MVLNGVVINKIINNKMKKFFLKNDNSPVEFGDNIELDLIKEDKDGKKQMKHIKCKFLPELLPLLLEGDIITEKEVDDPEEDELEDDAVFDEFMSKISEFMQQTSDILQGFDRRIKKLEDVMKKPSHYQTYHGSQLRKIFPKIVEAHVFTL